MFLHKEAGKYISRIVCMVMFVLIQFDVFGYDLIYAAFCDDEPSAVLTVDDESSVSDSQGEYAEWSNPSYRTSSVRFFFFDSFCTLCFMPVYFSDDYRLHKRHYISESPIYITDSQSYIKFRTLLI